MPHDDLLGDTLSLPSGLEDSQSVGAVGTVTPLSKLLGGAHILDSTTNTWKFVRREESSTIREGDRLAILLHPAAGSNLPDCMRDGIAVSEARCLLGIEFS